MAVSNAINDNVWATSNITYSNTVAASNSINWNPSTTVTTSGTIWQDQPAIWFDEAEQVYKARINGVEHLLVPVKPFPTPPRFDTPEAAREWLDNYESLA